MDDGVYVKVVEGIVVQYVFGGVVMCLCQGMYVVVGDVVDEFWFVEQGQYVGCIMVGVDQVQVQVVGLDYGGYVGYGGGRCFDCVMCVLNMVVLVFGWLLFVLVGGS